MPRWGGSYAEVATFVHEAVARESASHADARYADLYWQFGQLEGDETDIFTGTGASWFYVEHGFEALLKAHPSSDVLLNAYANMACRAGMWDSYSTLRPRIDKRRSSTAWTSKFSITSCDRKFAAASANWNAPKSPPDTGSLGTENGGAQVPEPTQFAFWGVRLGEPRREVEQDKGRPAKIKAGLAIYYAAGRGDDGVIEIDYAPGPQPPAGTVRAIFYHGSKSAAPPGLPYLNRMSGEQVYDRFGNPTWSKAPNSDSEYQMFRDGLTLDLWHRSVVRYGLQSYYKSP